MKWDQHNPGGTGNGRRPHSGWMDQFLARESERQAAMLDDLHARLAKDRERNPDALPSKEHMRAARFAQDGFKHLADLQLENARLELLAIRVLGRQQPMTDDEYQAKLAALGRDAIGTLSAEDLEAELTRRRALSIASEP